MRKIIIVTALLAAALVTAGCDMETTADPNISASPSTSKSDKSGKDSKGGKDGKDGASADGLHTVVYTVTGPSSALITYSTPSGQEQDNGADLPWKKKFKAKGGEFLSVSAQNSGSGTITCEITVDGKVVKRARSKGSYAVVSCDSMLGL